MNSYEPHEHVYEELRNKPGLVMIRGNGIVASRVLQRIVDDRDKYGLQTQILHLFRTYRTESFGPSIFERRKARNGWTYQGFNWPKSAWGGGAKYKFESLEGEARAAYYKRLAGTTTPARKDWKAQLARGRSEGWYRTYIGTVDSVHPGPDGTVETLVQSKDGSQLTVPAHFIVDATGLEAEHPRAPVVRRPARPRRRRPQPARAPRRRARLRGARRRQPARAPCTPWAP